MYKDIGHELCTRTLDVNCVQGQWTWTTCEDIEQRANKANQNVRASTAGCASELNKGQY